MSYTWAQAEKLAHNVARDPNRVFWTVVKQGNLHVAGLIRGNEMIVAPPGEKLEEFTSHKALERNWNRVRPLVKPRKVNDQRADRLWDEIRVRYFTVPAA